MTNNSPIEAQKELVSKLKGSTIQDILKFLDGKEMSEKEYSTEYGKVKTIIDSINGEIAPLVAYLNTQKADFSSSEWKSIQDVLSTFKKIKERFQETILSPKEFSEKLNKDIPLDLGNITPISTYDDIELSPSELAALNPSKLLAKTSGGVLYFLVNYKNSSTILRYNPNDKGDEVALFMTPFNDQMTKEDIRRIITNAERQGFRDIEMDGTWDPTLSMEAAVAGGIAGGATGTGVGAAAGLGVLSIPGGVVGGTIGAIGGSTIAGISTMWDKDYTSEDFENDYGTKISELYKYNPKLNYKK